MDRRHFLETVAGAALDFIRVNRDKPFFAYVPFTIPHTRFQVPDLGAYGTVSDHISGFQDIMPTLAALAGVDAPEGIDGISFVPTLTGMGRQRQHDALYWELGNQQAVRMGPWKALRRIGRQDVGPIELYHLPDDIAESNDLAKSHPGLVRRMEQILREARKPSKLFPHKVLDHLPI